MANYGKIISIGGGNVRKIKQLRKKTGLTQKEFGALFNLTRQQYNGIELNKRKGSPEFWLLVQKKYNLSSEETLYYMEVE